jgi:hypothetical protein
LSFSDFSRHFMDLANKSLTFGDQIAISTGWWTEALAWSGGYVGVSRTPPGSS